MDLHYVNASIASYQQDPKLFPTFHPAPVPALCDSTTN